MILILGGNTYAFSQQNYLGRGGKWVPLSPLHLVPHLGRAPSFPASPPLPLLYPPEPLTNNHAAMHDC